MRVCSLASTSSWNARFIHFEECFLRSQLALRWPGKVCHGWAPCNTRANTNIAIEHIHIFLDSVDSLSEEGDDMQLRNDYSTKSHKYTQRFWRKCYLKPWKNRKKPVLATWSGLRTAVQGKDPCTGWSPQRVTRWLRYQRGICCHSYCNTSVLQLFVCRRVYISSNTYKQHMDHTILENVGKLESWAMGVNNVEKKSETK